jgi:cell division control protein 24
LDPHLELPLGAQRLDVVNHIWLSFRLGSSLCHLFNMLLPIFDTPESPSPIPIEFPDFDYAEEHGVLSWGSRPENIKQCKKGAAKFIMTLTTLRKDGKWPENDPLWAIHELFGVDTGGLVKVLRTIGILLDKLPASAWIREDSGDSPSTPFTMERSGSISGLQDTYFPLPNGGQHQHMPSINGTPFQRPPSAAASSAYYPSHRPQLSTASHHGRPGFEIPNGQGTMQSGGGSRAAPGLHINTSLDRSKSYGGVGSNAGATPDPSNYGPMSALPQLETRQGDARPVDCGQAAMHVWEILKTEKKYVQELEILAEYSQSLLQHSLVAPDTVHLIFSNLGKLLDFQVGGFTYIDSTG